MSDIRPSLPAIPHRPRGRLEALVRELCEGVASGAIERSEGPFTPFRLSRMIAKRWPGSGVVPSTGGIADTLKRWEELGYAVIGREPLAFVDFTPEGRDLGLDALKERRRAARLVRRKATPEEAGQAHVVSVTTLSDAQLGVEPVPGAVETGERMGLRDDG